jgi:septum formation topological specificity factor MinE
VHGNMAMTNTTSTITWISQNFQKVNSQSKNILNCQKKNNLNCQKNNLNCQKNNLNCQKNNLKVMMKKRIKPILLKLMQKKRIKPILLKLMQKEIIQVISEDFNLTMNFNMKRKTFITTMKSLLHSDLHTVSTSVKIQCASVMIQMVKRTGMSCSILNAQELLTE